MVFGVDQSLSNTGIIKLDVLNQDEYFKDVKNILNNLKLLINVLNNRKQEYLKILKKSINKSFNFENELKKSKFSEKEKILILNYIEDLKLSKGVFINKYPQILEFFNELISIQNGSNNTLNLDTYFKFEQRLISPKTTNTERLSFYKKEYDMIIKENLNIIDIAVIEGYSYGSQATQSVFELGELAGQFKCINYDNNIETIIVPPSTLKKVIIGNGKVKKPEIIEFFTEKLNIKFGNKKSDDLYDALGLSLFVALMPYLELEMLLKIKFND